MSAGIDGDVPGLHLVAEGDNHRGDGPIQVSPAPMAWAGEGCDRDPTGRSYAVPEAAVRQAMETSTAGADSADP